MNIVTDKHRNFNHQGKASPAILDTLDLLDHEIDYCQDQATGLAELALWYSQQAAARIAERRSLAADATEVLRQAEEVLR